MRTFVTLEPPGAIAAPLLESALPDEGATRKPLPRVKLQRA